MTEQFAESFRIETFFNADSSVSVPEKMKIDISDSCLLYTSDAADELDGVVRGGGGVR